MLTPAEVARIEEAIPASAIAGSRYDEHQMRTLDSEHASLFSARLKEMQSG